MKRDGILILGGGLAGLAAADRLVERGFHVTVVEARERLGGRVWTVQGATGATVELGAEFIHGRGPGLWRLLERSGLPWLRVSERRQSDATEDRWEQIQRVLAHEPERAWSVAEWLEHLRLRPEERRIVEGFVEGYHAAPVNAASAWAVFETGRRAAAQGQEEQWRLEHGYGALVCWLEAELRKRGVEFVMETPVTRLRWTRGRVTVSAETRGGAWEGVGRAAVVTLPLGVLLSETVRFEPLPNSAWQAARKLAFGMARRMSLEFDPLRWPEDVDFIHRLDGTIPVWWRDPRGPVLTGWLGGPQAGRWTGAKEVMLQALALETLASLVETTSSVLRGALRGFHSHDWAADGFSRGAYSYIPVGGLDAAEALSAPVEDTLYFAGEACSPDCQFGTVHGAVESGVRTADRVAR